MALPQLGESEIEEIIARNLTRGQIRVRFGVGEHAAQLARTTAVAIARERERAPGGGGLDAALLRKLAEEWLALRDDVQASKRLGTDRSKVTLFLDWLEAREAACSL